MNKLHTETISGAPASYHSLLSRYSDVNFDYIIEGGSRDCVDAIKLFWTTNKKVYAFECNPTCVDICNKNLSLNKISNDQVSLVKSAVYHENTNIDFYCTVDTPKPPFGKNAPNLIEVGGKKANIGTSSILPFNEKWEKIHTSEKVTVPAITLDSFIEKENLQALSYILCLDLQGSEFYALKGNEAYLKKCQLIVLEGGTHQYKAPDECKMQSITSLLSNFGFVHANKHKGGDAVFTKN